ncbi:MAG: cytosine permease [Galbitalea sp.]
MAITEAPRTSATTVEPGGIEAIPASKRHGSPWQLLATWSAPNLEFATVFVGVIAVAFFGLGFWQAIAAIVLGNALGGATQGILSTWGPREGLAQLVLSRTAFGTRGNILPAGINALVAGIGWFAVNSVSGAFALSLLIPALPTWASLIIIVILEIALAFVGHDLVQIFERYASVVLGVIFLIAVIAVFISAHTAVSGHGSSTFSFGGFTLTAAAAFGYAAGWNPYASDYSRYLPKATSRVKIFWAAGLGNFVSCTILMAAGRRGRDPRRIQPRQPDRLVRRGIRDAVLVREITLVAIAVGAIAANALNVYSGGHVVPRGGHQDPVRPSARDRRPRLRCHRVLRRALGPRRRGHELHELPARHRLLDRTVARGRLRRCAAAPRSRTSFPTRRGTRTGRGSSRFIVATAVSIWLFSNQTFYVGLIAKATTPAGKYAISDIGDLTAIVGFVLAGVLYFVLFKAFKPKLGGPLAERARPRPSVSDAADAVA